MKIQNLGIIGGTFDPVHKGHLIIAECMRETLKLDKVYFIPNHIHPFQKRNDITPDLIRLQMLQTALTGCPYFKIDTIELDKKGISYSIDTLRSFREKYPSANLYLLIGEDNYSEFSKWKEPDSIKNIAQVVVYNRKSSGRHKAQNEKNVLFVKSPEIDISSTLIRDRIKKGLLCNDYLPAGVEKYIHKNGLYL